MRIYDDAQNQIEKINYRVQMPLMNNKAQIIKVRDEVFDKEMLRNTILNDGI